MRGRWMLGSTLILALGLGDTLRATHPVPADETLQCEVGGDTVKLSWNIVFIAPILGWIVSRDGADIARLPPEATSCAATRRETGR